LKNQSVVIYHHQITEKHRIDSSVVKTLERIYRKQAKETNQHKKIKEHQI